MQFPQSDSVSVETGSAISAQPGQAFSIVDRVHSHALGVANQYRRTEAELIDVFQQVEEHRVFIKRGHSSLFDYVTTELRLGESTAYCLIGIARKAREVPELKAEIESGKITLSNARRIAPVLTPKNKAEWLEKARLLSNRQLEKEIVRVHPKSAVHEKASYVTPDRVKLTIGLSEREMLKLRRVQDLLSQNRRRPVSLEEAIEAVTAEYLGRHDPVVKAKRFQVRKGSVEPSVVSSPGAKPEGARCGGMLVRTEGETRNSSAVAISVSASPTATAAVQEVATTAEVSAARKVAVAVGSDRSTVLLGKLVTLRVPIPRSLLHKVNLRDERRCTQRLRDGSRCNQTRWIEVHHIQPVSEGGANTLENLVTLCSAHHRFEHMQM